MKFLETVKMLGQLSVVEKILFVLFHCFNGVLPRKRRDLLEIKDVLKFANLNNYVVKKVSNKNLITVDSDSDVGGYKVLLRRMTSDYAVFRQIFMAKEYKPLVDLIDKNNKRENIKYIIDAGANNGCSAIYLKKCFKNSEIISIEPDCGLCAIAEENIKINKINNIIVLNNALWINNNKLELDYSFRDKREWSFSVKPAGKSTKEIIYGVTIPDIMEKYSFPYPDILKMDIEGAERFIFNDEEHVKRFLPKVRYLAMEVHDEYNIQEMILGILEKYNFSHSIYGERLIACNRDFSY